MSTVTRAAKLAEIRASNLGNKTVDFFESLSDAFSIFDTKVASSTIPTTEAWIDKLSLWSDRITNGEDARPDAEERWFKAATLIESGADNYVSTQFSELSSNLFATSQGIADDAKKMFNNVANAASKALDWGKYVVPALIVVVGIFFTYKIVATVRK